jgi:hypothetical protein
VDERSSDLGSKDPRIEAAIRSYIEKVDAGKEPELEGFVAQYPEFSDELRSFIETELRLRRMAAPQSAQQEAAHSTQSFTCADKRRSHPKERDCNPRQPLAPA